MKKSILIFVTVFLAALIVYGGSGVNAYFYCCNDCRDEGMAAIIEHKCCEIHHHHHLNGLMTHYDDHLCEQNISNHSDKCGVERISANLIFSADNEVQVQPAVIDIDFKCYSVTQDSDVEIDVIKSDIYIPSQKPPNLSKNDYFSLLTTLII